MLKFPRKKVGEQKKQNGREREDRKEGRDGKEGKRSGRERKYDLFGQDVEKEGESTQEETKVIGLLPGRKEIV